MHAQKKIYEMIIKAHSICKYMYTNQTYKRLPDKVWFAYILFGKLNASFLCTEKNEVELSIKIQLSVQGIFHFLIADVHLCTYAPRTITMRAIPPTTPPRPTMAPAWFELGFGVVFVKGNIEGIVDGEELWKSWGLSVNFRHVCKKQ